ncbi:hypothetical protein HQ590_05710 [bacterium]|nr:hypothetical protein [bacterium]
MRMRGRRLTSILLLLCLVAVAAHAGGPQGPNLLTNSDFERGHGTPEGWQTIDGLTTFWVDDPDSQHGKVLKVDTDVDQTQAYQWWSKIRAGAAPQDAPVKTPNTGSKEGTLAGLDGVWFYSDPVPVEPGKAYWLTIDVKGPPILLWLQGYPEKPDTTYGAEAIAFLGWLGDQDGTRTPVRGHQKMIHPNDWKGRLDAGGANEWKTYSRRKKPFRPTAKTPNVRWVRVLLLPYWPPATYYIDNVRLTEWAEDGENP